MTHQPPESDPTVIPPQPPSAPQILSAAPDPQYLGYRSARDERRQWPKAVQAFIGFVLSAAVSAAVNFASGFVAFNFDRKEAPAKDALVVVIVTVIVSIPLLVFGAIGLAMRRRGWWPAFLPGALAGWGVAALVEGICFVRLR